MIQALKYLLIANIAIRSLSSASKMALKSVEFEVHGRVQGVFFRKFTKEQADKLGLRGWCKNTDNGTVVGSVQGDPSNIETMLQWLKTTGSPMSRIEKAEFKNHKNISSFEFENFSIRRD